MSPPTINDVAARAGVSKSLVSLVMRGSPNVSPARRAAVLAAAKELGYRPNAAARSLARQRTNVIGVMVSDLHNPFYAEVLDGVEEAAAAAGYTVLINSGQRIASREEAAIETLLELRADALILGGTQVGNPVLTRVAAAVPSVIVGKISRADGIDSVANDERVGARLAVEHLVSLGHRRIAHIDGGKGTGSQPRRRAFETAMRDHDLTPQVVPGEFTEEAGLHGARTLAALDEPPTAIFAANDLSAIGVIQGLDELSLRVPEDVSVIGYDNTHISALRRIGLSTIDQPRQEIGVVATELLVERMEGERAEAKRVVVEPTLVARRTTSAPPKGR